MKIRPNSPLADFLAAEITGKRPVRALELDAGAPAWLMLPSGHTEPLIPKTSEEISDLLGGAVKAIPLPTTGHKSSVLWVESSPAPDAGYNDAATRTLRFFLTKIANVTFEPPPVRGRAVLVVGTFDHETEN